MVVARVRRTGMTGGRAADTGWYAARADSAVSTLLH